MTFGHMAQQTRKSATIFGVRFRQARLRAGLSQKEVGVLAGIDEFVASSRINQYERGVHTPDHATACKLARVLRVPAAFLYSDDDRIAELLLAVAHLTSHQIRQLAHRLTAQVS
jgi:transcriptional regulator with XRE-family HTH domain